MTYGCFLPSCSLCLNTDYSQFSCRLTACLDYKGPSLVRLLVHLLVRHIIRTLFQLPDLLSTQESFRSCSRCPQEYLREYLLSILTFYRQRIMTDSFHSRKCFKHEGKLSQQESLFSYSLVHLQVCLHQWSIYDTLVQESTVRGFTIPFIVLFQHDLYKSSFIQMHRKDCNFMMPYVSHRL